MKIINLSILTIITMGMLSGCASSSPDFLKPNTKVLLENQVMPVSKSIYDTKFNVNENDTLSTILLNFKNVEKIGNKDIYEKKIGSNLNNVNLKDVLKLFKEKFEDEITIKNRGNIYYLTATAKQTNNCNNNVGIDSLHLESSLQILSLTNPDCNYLFQNTKLDTNTTDTTQDYSDLITFSGKSDDLVKRISSKYNLIVENNNNNFTFKNYASKTIKLNISDVSLSNSNLKIENENNPFIQLSKALNSQFPNLKVDINQGTGLLHMTGSSQDLLAAENGLVKKYNDIYSKTIMISVDILSIDANNLDERGIDINSLVSSSLNVASGQALGNIGLVQETWQGTVNNTASLIDNKGSGLLSFTSSGGSTAVINFLKKNAKTETLQSPRMRVTNTVPTNFSILEEYSYVSKFDETSNISSATTTTTETTNALAATTRVPVIEKVESGIVFDISATIEEDDKIKINIRPVLKKFLGFDIVKYKGVNDIDNEIKTPHTQVIDFSQIFNIQENETAVIGGMRVTTHQKTIAGLPDTDLKVLGALDNSQIVATDMNLVMVITAKIVN